MIAAGTGRLDLEAERPRWARRVEAWARATAKMESGKGRVAQKAVEKVGDRHLPKEEVGPDKPRQDVEGKGGAFRGAGLIDLQESLDKKEEGVPPSAINGEKSRAKEHHKIFVADSSSGGLEMG